ncbi:MAG: hypothetical protein K2M23_01170 [Alphaproteobacteria bacterium]|nr:hypothetical protein [Alphaproteobacteria bacterium]
MNKKILTSAVVLSGLLFGGNVFAADYIDIEGEGICEMALPANAMKEKKDFEFLYSDRDIFFDDEGEYVGFDKLLKKIRSILPDAVITSYKWDIGNNNDMFFNIDTKLQKDLIGLADVEYANSVMDEGIGYNLTDEFKSSKEFLDCKDIAIKSAMKNAMDKAKILKAKIVSGYNPSEYIYKIEDGKIRYYSTISYKAVAD